MHDGALTLVHAGALVSLNGILVSSGPATLWPLSVVGKQISSNFERFSLFGFFDVLPLVKLPSGGPRRWASESTFMTI